MRGRILQRIKTKYEEFIKIAEHSEIKNIETLKNLSIELENLFKEFRDSLAKNVAEKGVAFEDGTVVPYRALVAALIFAVMYKNRNEKNIVAISYSVISRMTGAKVKEVKEAIDLLKLTNFIRFMEFKPPHISQYLIIRQYKELDSLDVAYLISVNELDEISPEFLTVLKKISKEFLGQSLPPAFDPKYYKGLTRVSGVFIPTRFVRIAFVFAALHTFRNTDNITQISILTLKALVGSGYGTIKKEIKVLEEKGFIVERKEKKTSTFEILKIYEELDAIEKNRLVFNIKDFVTVSADPQYERVLIRICEDLAGISFSKINKKEEE